MMQAINLTDYYRGLEEGRDEIYQLIFDILADQREKYVDEDFVVVHVLDHIGALLDAHVDEMRGVWNAH